MYEYDHYIDPEDYDVAKSCYHCEKHEDKNDRLIGTLKKVIQIMYHDESIDTAKLDDLLQDLCLDLKVKFPMNKFLNIMRPKTPENHINEILNDWMDYNYKTLNQQMESTHE